MNVAGVDGCPAGWIVAIAETANAHLTLREVLVVPTFRDMLSATDHCAAVAVDIPIGLPDMPPRAADLAARRLLRPIRGSSVFPAPPRFILDATDYVNACALSRDACGRAISLQAFNILSKIREADAALTPLDQARVCESHPEVVFAALDAGAPMQHNKKTLAGRIERAALLSILFDEDISLRPVPPGAKRDDFYDAAVLTWTAARLARGEAQRLPPEPQLDARGLRMEIVY